LTRLQLLDFQKLQIVLSHFDGFFGIFMGEKQFSMTFITNLLPLSLKKVAN
jgi:hypothetical protein